jgi:hypothetical protein
MDPYKALGEVRAKLAELWDKFKGLAPVVAVLGLLSQAKGKLGGMTGKMQNLFKTEIPPVDEKPKLTRAKLSVGHEIPISELKQKIKNHFVENSIVTKFLIEKINAKMLAKAKTDLSEMGDTFDDNAEIMSYITVT